MKKLLFLLLIACNQEQQVKVGRFSIKVFDTIYTPFKTAEEKKEEERKSNRVGKRANPPIRVRNRT